MRILIAFDKFKDSITAPEACLVCAATLRQQHPDWAIETCPVTDGGEGFTEILTGAAQGAIRQVTVTGPRGGNVVTGFGLIPGRQIPAALWSQLSLHGSDDTVALVEMASASGLALLDPAQRDVWHTTTHGTGELLRAAASAGAGAIVVGVGGSATSDLGLGALTALGLQPSDETGRPVESVAPAHWDRIARLDGRPLPLPPLFVACDVTNPLLGPTGAAAVYGPQKGLAPGDVGRLDDAAARIAQRLCDKFGKPQSLMDFPGAGAAGGIAFGWMVAADAQLLPGFEFVSRWLDLDARIAAADLVITGEGRFDASSLSGKGPGAIAARALAMGKEVRVFAGAVTAESANPRLTLHPISPEGMPLQQALRRGRENLASAVRRVFATL